ncbi:MAG: hydantoinase B/oxoprolinase family protein [Gammaproteobacteria bacterium]|nr:hydantoinase B/oxoprolinase family protein [Gammaproteobacteria bacterium]
MNDDAGETQQHLAGDARVDPVTASIIYGALENIAVEMGFKLMRMSYSSIIRESEDFGAALCDERGRQLCECKKSTPLQSGPIPGYVRGILKQLEARGQRFQPGDVVIHNDAYNGASHSPDIGFCVPVFHQGELVGFSMTTAHHLDIGSCEPGSVGISNCADAYAEGLQFKALKVYEQGRRNDTVWQLIRDNVRVPDLIIGDMEAQIAACHIGARRFVALIERFGLEAMRNASEDLFDYSERLMRAQIEKIPDGVYTATGYVDGYLDNPDPSLKHLPVCVTVTVQGSELHVDLTGTAAQVEGHAINMPFIGTVDVAIWLTLRSILLDTEVHGDIPQNHGLYRPVHISAPAGCLANPTFPVPTMARVSPGNILADTLMHALAPVLPEQVCAGIANLKALGFSGLRGGQHWVHIEIFEGSYGGRHGKDGMDSVDTLYANTRNNPIEDIETHVPLRVNRYELRDDACAAGRWRGGISVVKEMEFLADGAVSAEGDGHSHAPWGFAGGSDGVTSRLVLKRRSGEEIDLPSMLQTRPARIGDRYIAIGGSGGGYGNPMDRVPARVLDDYLDGYITRAEAQDKYGVVITGGSELDATATDTLRRGAADARSRTATGRGA